MVLLYSDDCNRNSVMSWIDSAFNYINHAPDCPNNQAVMQRDIKACRTSWYDNQHSS